MPAPCTIVKLVADDGDEFPVRLPCVYPENRGADFEAALQIAGELVQRGEWRPTGALRPGEIEYAE